jgi:hypothetical protein
MKLSRRTMLALAGASAALAQTPAQTTPAPQAAAPTDPLEKARAENRQSAENLTRFEIPMATEPAFTFRA